MKKSICFASGFTIAELLVAMLISAVVAAALVPIIGLKKIKSPTNKFNHGIAECYYAPTGPADADGRYPGWSLMYYYADNGRNRDAEPRALGQGVTQCTFNVPKGNFFEIITIGAGTNGNTGGQTPQFGNAVAANDNRFTGFIPVNSDYLRTIQNAALGDGEPIGNRLQTLLNEWAAGPEGEFLYADYLFDSPVGAGGAAPCAPIIFKPASHPECVTESDSDVIAGNGRDAQAVLRTSVRSNCAKVEPPANLGFWLSQHIHIAESLAETSPEPASYFFIHGAGENSGEGVSTNRPLRVHLSGNTGITVTDDDRNSAGITIRENGNTDTLTLSAALAGRTPSYNDGPRQFMPLPFRQPETARARCNGTLRDSVDCRSNGIFNRGAPSGSEDATSCRYRAGETLIRGRVYYGDSRDDDQANNPNKLRWNFNAIIANPRIGTGGQMGAESRVVFENLKGTLYLRPAPNGSNASSLVLVDPNDPETFIASAESATQNGRFMRVPFNMVREDMPIPAASLAAAKPQNQNFEYLSKLTSSRFNGGLRNCNNVASPWCPGFAGNGDYFYIDNLPDVSSLTVTNLYNNRSYTLQLSNAQQQQMQGQGFCDDGVTVPINATPVGFRDANGDEQTFTPRYCREGNIYGRPGAVIIIW